MSDPLEVLLQFAFLGVLYLFLLWVARSALRDLGRPAADSYGEHERAGSNDARPYSGRLVVERGAGLGERRRVRRRPGPRHRARGRERDPHRGLVRVRAGTRGCTTARASSTSRT